MIRLKFFKFSKFLTKCQIVADFSESRKVIIMNFFGFRDSRIGTMKCQQKIFIGEILEDDKNLK